MLCDWRANVASCSYLWVLMFHTIWKRSVQQARSHKFLLVLAYPFRGLQFDTRTIPRQHLNCFWCRLLCTKWKNLHLMSAYSDFSVWCYQLSTCLCGLWPKVSSRHRHVSYRSMSSPAPFRPDWLCTLRLGTGRQFAFPETKDDDKNVPL